MLGGGLGGVMFGGGGGGGKLSRSKSESVETFTDESSITFSTTLPTFESEGDPLDVLVILLMILFGVFVF